MTDFSLRELGETEIENLHPTVVRYEEVLWLEIAMDDAFLVSGRQTMRDL
jgi:hypothetical protein